ncbi:uncharacterized protein LOC116165170 isoform X1 [Photinus pyralis]|uniref:uncharacterized protein LOC116165170 isoform X1 n=2 Tax=Photinus pyralis TaxID=7054 RepID=UPI0012675B76|nr:uncharacterized protein LOC116165170 isoform X1 [Photinus pyralis]
MLSDFACNALTDGLINQTDRYLNILIITVSLSRIDDRLIVYCAQISLKSVTFRSAMEVHVDDSQTQPLEVEKDFIITFETMPILWDKTDKDYVNKYKRNEALEKLLVIYKKIKPQVTLDDVKKKINTLRSNYRRELKKIESSRRSGAGGDDIYTPKSWTFEYLHFLGKFEKPQILDTDGDDNADGPSPDLTQPQEQERMESQRSVSSISSANTVMPPPPAKKAKKTMLAKQNELLDRACAYLSEPNSSSSGANSLACHWAETLDRLDPTQRLYAKKAINDVLFEAELGNLHRHAVQINTATYMPYLRSPRISQHSPQPSPHSSQPSPPPPHSPQSSPYSPQPSPDSSQPSPHLSQPFPHSSQSPATNVLTPLSSPSLALEFETQDYHPTYSNIGSLFTDFTGN